MNVLVIGGDSFIAQKFIKYVSELFSVKALSRKKTGFSNELVFKDFWNIPDELFSKTDIVINFAAIVHAKRRIRKELFYEINYKLVVENAIKAKRNGVRQFIQMSTIAVYGYTNYIDINTKVKPVNAYGHSKLFADYELGKLEDDNFKVAIIRPPMVYGGGNAPGNMMKLIQFAQKGFPLPFKDINNKRDFIHVLNLVKSLTVVIENKKFGIILPTDKKAVSTSEIIDLVKVNSLNPVRQIRVPEFILAIGKKIIPSIYNKLFDSLRVECNLSEEIYQPEFTISNGVMEMIAFLEHS